ncbi:MAG TPA: hypothetical protein VME23_02175 [Terracidiphilus sp.]|nr:hypothetical protein [Terracidiphilus sp.]
MQVFAVQGWIVFEPNYRGSGNLGNRSMSSIFKDAGAGLLTGCPWAIHPAQNPLLPMPSRGKLFGMGSKDKGRKEVKKAPKPKPKPEPGHKREIFTPPPPPK